MLYTMKLKSEPFEKMKSGSKTIELRLNDEKSIANENETWIIKGLARDAPYRILT